MELATGWGVAGVCGARRASGGRSQNSPHQRGIASIRRTILPVRRMHITRHMLIAPHATHTRSPVPHAIHRVIDPPWEMPGIDITDFFNYGFTPDTWKDYCAEVHQFRVEFSMQKKISTMGAVAGAPPVFVDPELPPELRAAVAAHRMGGVAPPTAPFAVRWVRKSGVRRWG